MKKKIIATLLLALTTQSRAEEAHQEKFSEKAEVVAITVKDIVTDTAQTVKRSMHEGAEVAKEFLASTAARLKIKMQEARAKQAEQKAHAAREEKEKAQQELTRVQEQLKQAQAALKRAREQMPAAR